MTEDSRQRRNLAKNLGDLGREEWALDIPYRHAEVESTSTRQGRYFEQLAKDVGLGNGYVTYRVLSGLSHPSVQVADAYLGSRDDGGVVLRHRGKPLSHDAEDGWGHLIATCLVWSGYVVNYLDPNRTRRSELRRVARELGVAPELPIRAEGIDRVNRQRRQARRR